MKKEQTITRPMPERIAMIHEKINAGKYPSTSKLADFIEVSSATICRDIDFLKNRLYAPVAYDSTRCGFYYSKPFELPKDFKIKH